MNISAVLLAGGESRRMGSDKATLAWRGRPLWEWQIEKLRALQPETIFVSARFDVMWRPADAELILDAPPSRGPLSGLVATLARTKTDHLLILAVDMPFMTVERLRVMCEAAAEGVGAISVIDGRAEPLGAIYPKESLPVLTEALESNNFSLQPVVQRLIDLNMLRVLPLAPGAGELYRSVNERRDLV